MIAGQLVCRPRRRRRDLRRRSGRDSEGPSIREGGEWEQWDWETDPPSRLQDQTPPSNESRSFADDGKPTEPTEGQPHHEIEQPPRLDAEGEAALDRAAERVRREGERKRLEEKFGWGPGDETIKSKEEFLRKTSEGSRMDRVIVADLGVEGGGATIFGHIIGDRWVFRQGGSSIALDADDNEGWRTWESDSAADLSAVVPTNWPLMYPIKVHPEFVDWFRDHYEAARASLRDDLRAYQPRSSHGDWRKVFGEAGNL